MNNSPIEKEFIGWCKSLHPDFNAYIFIQRHNRYLEEYFPLLDEIMTDLHQEISNKNPNINFYFRGRVKSKRSFLIKTFRTIAENLEEIFPQSLPDDPEKLKKVLEDRDYSIQKFFKFLIKENPEKFEKINTLIKTVSPAFDPVESFKMVFSQLNSAEQDKLVTRLGRTEDAFAFRFIVDSVDFNISSVSKKENGEFEIVDDKNVSTPIRPAISINPEKDIIREPNGSTYVLINGKKERLDERNLLYPRDISLSDKNMENALKDANGNLTLLYDSLVVNDNEHFDIVSIKSDPITNDTLVYNQFGECKDLSLLLSSNKSLKLRKTDEEYTIPALYDISNITKDYYENNDIISIASRFKDYIKNPKTGTNYKSLHDSAFHKLLGCTIEAQIRDQKMEADCKNENTSTGHDQYKQNKMKRLLDNFILSKILKNNPLAFDSSTPTLLKILDNPHIELSEILSKYLLITKMRNGKSVSYQPTIDKSFEHAFEHSDKTLLLDPNDTAPPLDVSSYKKFIQSRKIRNEFKRNENEFPDFYE